jgi:hypothetical protein
MKKTILLIFLITNLLCIQNSCFSEERVSSPDIKEKTRKSADNLLVSQQPAATSSKIIAR